MGSRSGVNDLIKEAGYCVPCSQTDGTIEWDCHSGVFKTSQDIPRIEARKVVLDENNKPRLNRGTGDWLVAKQEDVIANAI